MTLALYRKYRPKTFADFFGQVEVRIVLQRAAQENRFAHAYLFYGPRGTGKTTAARLMAKLVNCETRINDVDFRAKGEPCNKCRVCNEVDAGNALDVIEIDAASNRGIDEIRALKDGIRVAPSSYAYKVFIIDEVHMLTREAFNALLKTLEEPPAHAILILATTEYDKIPPTITSRAQRFHFRRLTVAQITQKLQSIVAEEKLTINADALELIAAMAEGSARDAESVLGQVISLGHDVTPEAIERIVGRVGYRSVAAFASLLLAKDLPASLRELNNLYTAGHNIIDFGKELITYLRRVLALHYDPELATVLAEELPHDALMRLQKHAETLDPLFLISLLKLLLRAYTEMRYSSIAIAPFEVAIIEGLNVATSNKL